MSFVFPVISRVISYKFSGRVLPESSLDPNVVPRVDSTPSSSRYDARRHGNSEQQICSRRNYYKVLGNLIDVIA